MARKESGKYCMVKAARYICARAFIAIILLLPFYCLHAQEVSVQKYHILRAVIIGEDTLPIVSLPEITVYPKRTFKTRREEKRFSKLAYNIKKVYPYTIIAKDEFKRLNDSLPFITGERDRKLYMKQVEKQLLAKYEPELRKLTITQGRLLIKLIDREFGKSSYDIVKEYRGTLSAVFWQSLARLFGSNLKTKYDPGGEDRMIEEIVIRIENGEL